ncbi:MAG: hypothetical protein WCV59_00100 [Parcubacteria group bacterium]|jgi:NOL1/NOP2/fmu family ribosome biogenesis protein
MALNKAKIKNEIDVKFIPLSEAAKRSGYTPEHLNLSARKGKLQAQKIGRNWYTTEEWLCTFLELALGRSGEEKVGASEEIGEGVETDETLSNLESLRSLRILTRSEFPFENSDEKKSSNDEKEVFRDALLEVAGEKKSEKIFSKNLVQMLAGVSLVVIFIPIIFFSVYSVKYYAAQKNNQAEKIALVNETPSEVIVNENGNNLTSENPEEKVLGIVAGETTAADTEAQKKSGVVLASENFKAQNVSMGVGIVLASAEENAPLEITDVKSESFITGKKNNANSQEEVKLVVSWKTNKLAMSELDFSKNNGQDPKVLKENSFGFNHAVVLTGIDPRTSYVYQVKGKDHWGAEVSSDFYGLFTASKPVSVFDLISNQINEIFGWAIKK